MCKTQLKLNLSRCAHDVLVEFSKSHDTVDSEIKPLLVNTVPMVLRAILVKGEIGIPEISAL